MYEALSLKDKVVIVTGAAGGIGQATTEIAIGRGARVAVLDIKKDAAQAVAAKHGDAALAVRVDLADEASIVAAIQLVLAADGGVSVHLPGFAGHWSAFGT